MARRPTTLIIAAVCSIGLAGGIPAVAATGAATPHHVAAKTRPVAGAWKVASRRLATITMRVTKGGRRIENLTIKPTATAASGDGCPVGKIVIKGTFAIKKGPASKSDVIEEGNKWHVGGHANVNGFAAVVDTYNGVRGAGVLEIGWSTRRLALLDFNNDGPCQIFFHVRPR